MNKKIVSIGIALGLLIVTVVVIAPFRHWLASRVVPIGTEFTVTSTGYASSPYQTDASPCITAAGTVVRPGVVAANFLPFGTLLSINSDAYRDRLFIVEDRTNGRYKQRLDIWFPATSDALVHGVRTVTIAVVGHGTPGQELTLEEPKPVEEPAAIVDVPTELNLLEQASLEIESLSRLFAKYIGANVNQYDVDCSNVHLEEPAE